MQSWYYMRVRFVLALAMVMTPAALAYAQADEDEAGLESDDAALDSDDADTASDDELADDDALMDDDLDSPPPPGGGGASFDERAAVEVERPSPFSGKVTIAINAGLGLQLAGDRSVDPFRVGADQQETLDDAMPSIDPSALSLFAIAREIQDTYRTALPEPPQPNPFGLGFGARLGISLPEDPLFLAATFGYYMGGGTETLTGGQVTSGAMMVTQPTITTSLGLMMFGGEGGLEWAPMPWVVLRPSIGVGMALVSSEVCLAGSEWVDFQGVVHALAGGCESASTTHFYISPGLEVLMPLTSLFYVGGEGRFTGFSGEGGAVSFYLGATGGMTVELF